MLSLYEIHPTFLHNRQTDVDFETRILSLPLGKFGLAEFSFVGSSLSRSFGISLSLLQKSFGDKNVIDGGNITTKFVSTEVRWTSRFDQIQVNFERFVVTSI